jgi:hypothetical protein
MRRIIRATAALTLTAMPVVGVIATQPDGIQGSGRANVSAIAVLGHQQRVDRPASAV